MPGFKFNRLFRACACAGALGLSAAAMAEIRMHVAAEGGNAASDEQAFDDPVKHVSGHMFAGPGGAGGSIQQGPLACPGDLCGLPASTPGANAAATVNMNVGHMGVSARAWANPPEVFKARGSAVVNVDDTLQGTGPLTFDIRVSVGLAASNAQDTFSQYSFILAIRTDQDNLQNFFAFSAWDDPNREVTDEPFPTRGARASINRFWNGPGDGSDEFFDTVPAVFETSIVVPFFQGNSLELVMHNSARAEAEDSATASVSSLNSGWLGIEGSYTSASGFTYTGYTAAVPEPGTAMLWLLGGGLLAGAARRRTTQP